MFLSSDRYVVFDVETTGFNPQHGARVIEIGAVHIENGHIISEFKSLINCGKTIPKQTQKVHGITDEMLFGEPAPEEVFPDFIKFISKSTLVAHNAVFDIRFLRYELSRLGFALNNDYLCTLNMSRTLFPELQNHKLLTVAKHVLGDIPENLCLHRALDDARLTAMIWMEMVK
ncbi:MAG: 3'-5' exoribonuclease [Proteobacteria bacterium]|nr:3'-5' exoribonuclease [Pseudomonadota bacterium]